MKFGYARASRLEENLELQITALKASGCDEIVADEVETTSEKRPALNALLKRLSSGDELVIWRLDRLGQTLRNLVELVNELGQKNIRFKSLMENIDTSTDNGHLIVKMFAHLAEFERNIIRERTLDGLSLAREMGRFGGRPQADQSKVIAALDLYHKKEFTVKQICSKIGISKGTLYRYLRNKS